MYPYTAEAPPTTGSHPSILHAAHAALRDGKSAVLDADTSTAVALRRVGLPAVYVFVLPADSTALRDNLHAAYGGDEADPAAVAATLAFAEREMAILERDASVYDFTVVNKGDEAALESLAGCLKDAYTAEQVCARLLHCAAGPQMATSAGGMPFLVFRYCACRCHRQRRRERLPRRHRHHRDCRPLRLRPQRRPAVPRRETPRRCLQRAVRGRRQELRRRTGSTPLDTRTPTLTVRLATCRPPPAPVLVAVGHHKADATCC